MLSWLNLKHDFCLSFPRAYDTDDNGDLSLKEVRETHEDGNV